MNATVGWLLAAAAIAVGYLQWGWPGVALGVTVVVFWLLLQYSRALRVLRMASQSPVGHVDSAVMLHSKLQPGQRLPKILSFTRSLGIKLDDHPETFEWRDVGGDAVRVELVEGKLTRWELQRAPVAADADAPPPAP
jgi:hypothetical protein